MLGTAVKIVIEPALAEELVQMMSRDNPDRLAEYSCLKEKVYEQPVDTRQNGFYESNISLLERWGISGAVAATCGEFSILDDKITEVLIARTRSKEGEGADLSWDNQRVGIKIKAERFLDPHDLNVFLRHELMHIHDLLDEDFGYRKERLDLTPNQEARVRERYGLLWDISIESRLARAGKGMIGSQEMWQARFCNLFSALPEEKRLPVFQGIWDTPQSCHKEILETALEPARFLGSRGAETTPRMPGGKCPLCQFPTHKWEDAPSQALALVQADFPTWQPEEGMCPRCSEYYALKAGIW